MNRYVPAGTENALTRVNLYTNVWNQQRHKRGSNINAISLGDIHKYSKANMNCLHIVVQIICTTLIHCYPSPVHPKHNINNIKGNVLKMVQTEAYLTSSTKLLISLTNLWFSCSNWEIVKLKYCTNMHQNVSCKLIYPIYLTFAIFKHISISRCSRILNPAFVSSLLLYFTGSPLKPPAAELNYYQHQRWEFLSRYIVTSNIVISCLNLKIFLSALLQQLFN